MYSRTVTITFSIDWLLLIYSHWRRTYNLKILSIMYFTCAPPTTYIRMQLLYYQAILVARSRVLPDVHFAVHYILLFHKRETNASVPAEMFNNTKPKKRIYIKCLVWGRVIKNHRHTVLYEMMMRECEMLRWYWIRVRASECAQQYIGTASFSDLYVRGRSQFNPNAEYFVQIVCGTHICSSDFRNREHMDVHYAVAYATTSDYCLCIEQRG